MNIISTRDKDDMSQHAAAMIIERVRNQPSVTLGLATGSTPEGTYKRLIRDHREEGTSYQKVTTINLDEYVGLPENDPNSYRHFMEEQLFQHVDIPREQTHLPNGSAQDKDAECQRYDALIKHFGGIDFQLLGIGENGHIGFNEPGTPFESGTHIVHLDESTRKANARFFKQPEDVPTEAITMGIHTILQSKEIVLLASGSAKADAIAQLIHGEVNEQLPALALKKHDNVTLIADEEALAQSNARKKS